MTIPVLTSDEVRAAERAFPELLADGTLMQRAATAVATECMAVLREHGGVVGRYALLLVGAGDNGGDALFAGARLARRGVATVAVPVASRMHEAGLLAFQAAGGRIVDVEGALELFDRIDIVIDGIVGLGSSRGLDGVAAFLVRAIDDAQLFTVSIDVPSGVHADTGAVSGVAVHADVTITFGALRPAHVIAPAALHCGDVLIADIDVPMHSDDHAVTGEGVWFAPPSPDADKYARGVVGIVTGSAMYPGAALLSTSAAMRSGCGLVRYFGDASDIVVAANPEIVPAAHEDIREMRCNAWLVGCGLGVDADAASALRSVLHRDEPVVVDADAITLLALDARLQELLRSRTAPTLLTPHAGEASRIANALGISIDLHSDRLGAARAIARSLECCVLLKGPTTLITNGERFLATPLLGAQLATAGSGDVLAGLIAGAAARWNAIAAIQETAFMELAAAAALRHAAAALPADTVASDLLDGLDQGE